MINTILEQHCYILSSPEYTSNINGIIALNKIYPSNTPSMIFITVCDLVIIWILVNRPNIRFAIGMHVIRIGIIINNILLIVTHNELLYFYLIEELFLHNIVIMCNLLNIRILYCICINNGWVKLSVTFKKKLH